MEKEFPSYVIGHNQEFMEVLLDVLKNHDDAITNEAISLIELLQMNPKIKKHLKEKIDKLKNINVKQIQAANQEANNSLDTPDNTANGAEDAQQYNFKEWSQMLKWEPGGELNQTLYMLTCLKELTTGKQGQQGGP